MYLREEFADVWGWHKGSQWAKCLAKIKHSSQEYIDERLTLQNDSKGYIMQDYILHCTCMTNKSRNTEIVLNTSIFRKSVQLFWNSCILTHFNDGWVVLHVPEYQDQQFGPKWFHCSWSQINWGKLAEILSCIPSPTVHWPSLSTTPGTRVSGSHSQLFSLRYLWVRDSQCS